MRIALTISVLAIVLTTVLAHSKELVRHIEIQDLSRQPIRINASFYDNYLNYDSGKSENSRCTIRFYSSQGPYAQNTGLSGDMATIGLAYLVPPSERVPAGWSSYNAVDEKGRAAKVISYINPTGLTGRTNQIDRLCWE